MIKLASLLFVYVNLNHTIHKLLHPLCSIWIKLLQLIIKCHLQSNLFVSFCIDFWFGQVLCCLDSSAIDLIPLYQLFQLIWFFSVKNLNLIFFFNTFFWSIIVKTLWFVLFKNIRVYTMIQISCNSLFLKPASWFWISLLLVHLIYYTCSSCFHLCCFSFLLLISI